MVAVAMRREGVIVALSIRLCLFLLCFLGVCGVALGRGSVHVIRLFTREINFFMILLEKTAAV